MKYDTGSRVKMSPRVQQSTLRMKFTALSSLLMNGDLIRTLAPGLVWALWVQPAPGEQYSEPSNEKLAFWSEKSWKRRTLTIRVPPIFFIPIYCLCEIWVFIQHPASSILSLSIPFLAWTGSYYPGSIQHTKQTQLRKSRNLKSNFSQLGRLYVC